MIVAQPVEAAGYAIGECRVVNDTGRKEIRPFSSAGSYLEDFLSGDLYQKNRDRVGASFEGGKITLVKAPQHGDLVLSSDKKEASWGWYNYLPEEGYYGDDRFVIQVEKNGVKVTIHYVVIVISDDESPRGLCNPEEWKISLLDDMNVSFSDLPNSAVAQTTGSQIILQKNRDRPRFSMITPATTSSKSTQPCKAISKSRSNTPTSPLHRAHRHERPPVTRLYAHPRRPRDRHGQLRR